MHIILFEFSNILAGYKSLKKSPKFFILFDDVNISSNK